jgi:uncharacterized protein with von Willebrand factor type A (vWA) domain
LSGPAGVPRPAPEEATLAAIVALARAARRSGIAVSIDQELGLCRALAEVDLRERGQVYWAARACLLRRPEEIVTFDAIFRRFWAGLSLEPPPEGPAEHGESDPRMPGPQHGGDSLPQFRLEGRSSQLVDGESNRASQEIPTAAGPEEGSGRRKGVLAAYSSEEVLTNGSDLGYGPDELLAVRRLAAELRRHTPERRSRRAALSRRGGRLDVRRTVRRSLQTDGEAIRPAYVSHSRRPRRLVLLCDVSGSMERYSRALLGSMQAAVAAGVRAEAFVFATRLTRLTGTLSGRDVRRSLERARSEVEDWSGGTRIGAAIREFNRKYACLGLARGAIVIIVSDGWDRGDPELLVCELERLRLQARRLIWLNPRPGELEQQPLAVGMRAALPHVDDFVPGQDPRAVVGLAQLIAGVGSHRASRRQRPLASAAMGRS